MDKRLRGLERAAASGDQEAETRLFSERVRSGEINDRAAMGAAMTGHELAQAAFGVDSSQFEQIQSAENLQEWLPTLLEQLDMQSTGLIAAAEVRQVLEGQENERTEDQQQTHDILVSFEAYMRDPDSEEAELIRSLAPARDIDTAYAKQLGATENEFFGREGIAVGSLVQIQSNLSAMRMWAEDQGQPDIARQLRPIVNQEVTKLISGVTESIGVEQSKAVISTQLASEIPM